MEIQTIYYNFQNGLRYPHGEVEAINMILVWLTSLPDIFKAITLGRRIILATIIGNTSSLFTCITSPVTRIV